MTETMPAGAWGISYPTARRLLLAAGLVLLLVVAGVMYVRRVDTVEVVAVLLFIPVFVAFVFWNVVGGLAAAVAAMGVYIAMRVPAIDAVGWSRFTGLLFSRGLAYVAFGGIGGWANRQLEASLTKLDLYDEIDDETGLKNARFFVQDTQLEMARARRYQSIFSVVVVDIPADPIDKLGRRARRNVLRGLGRVLSESVRTVDRAAHGRGPAHGAGEFYHRIAVVLPETGREGADVFSGRLVGWISGFLNGRGATIDTGELVQSVFTYPDDETGLVAVRDEFTAIDRVEHPEAAEASESAEPQASTPPPPTTS